MSKIESITTFVKPLFRHFVLSLAKHYEALLFLQTHKIWKGVFKYGWISKALLVIAIVLGAKYLFVLIDWFGDSAENGFNTSSLMMLGSSSLSFWEDNFAWLFSSSRKYVILVLTEVITFHMVRSTLAILTGKEQDKTFKTFLKAQIRMIEVAFFSWIMELLIGGFLGFALGILSLSFLKLGLMFFVQCFFLGFALVDNYNEQYEMKVKKSYERTIPIAGAALGLGIIFYGLLYVPIAGPILAPCIGGVAAAILMLELEEKGDLLPYVAEVKTAKN